MWGSLFFQLELDFASAFRSSRLIWPLLTPSRSLPRISAADPVVSSCTVCGNHWFHCWYSHIACTQIQLRMFILHCLPSPHSIMHEAEPPHKDHRSPSPPAPFSSWRRRGPIEAASRRPGRSSAVDLSLRGGGRGRGRGRGLELVFCSQHVVAVAATSRCSQRINATRFWTSGTGASRSHGGCSARRLLQRPSGGEINQPGVRGWGPEAAQFPPTAACCESKSESSQTMWGLWPRDRSFSF